MDMLLGLDLLKRHQVYLYRSKKYFKNYFYLISKCIIDLDRNVLVIKSANVETRFLSESELPSHARLNFQDTAEDIKMAEEPKASSSNTSHSESAITNLTKLGFSRSDAIEALNSSNGNEDLAKIKLLAKSLQSPK